MDNPKFASATTTDDWLCADSEVKSQLAFLGWDEVIWFSLGGAAEADIKSLT